MSANKIKLDEILARTQAASEQKDQRKKDALASWRAHEDQLASTRVKTEKLRALRMEKEAQEAAEAEAEQARLAAEAPVRKRVRRTAAATAEKTS